MNQSKRWRHLLVLWLAMLLFVNPLAGAAAAAKSAPTGLPQRLSPYFGDLFDRTDMAAATEELDQKPDGLFAEALFEPILATISGYFGGLWQDERLESVLSEVINEIMADERLASFDAATVAGEILRDPRLSRILGEVIAEHLKDEKLLGLLEQLTSDLKVLLKDDQISTYLSEAINDLLNDPGINDLTFELIQALSQLADGFLSNLQDEAALQELNGVLRDFLAIFLEPLSNHFDELSRDPRIKQALHNIMLFMEGDGSTTYPGLQNLYLQRLEADAEFNQALEELLGLFLAPLLGNADNPDHFPGLPALLAEKIMDDLVLQTLLVSLVERLAGETDTLVDPILNEINAEISAILAQIGAEISNIIDHYGEHGGEGIPGEGGGGLPIEVDLLDALNSTGGDYLNYWFECIFFVLEQKEEELALILQRYFGQEAGYIDEIMEAFSAAAGEALAGLKTTLFGDAEQQLQGLLARHLAEVDLQAITEALLASEAQGYNGATWRELLSVAVKETFVASDLFDLYMDCDQLFAETIRDIIEAALAAGEGSPGGGLAEIGGLMAGLPFDVLADLFSKEQVKGWVGKLFELVDRLPLEELAPYVRDHADELGYSIAEALLHGIAESLTDPAPEDPRKTAIIKELRSEARLRQFYLDLGGAYPEKITADSSNAEIILAALLEIAGEEERLKAYREDLEQRSRPVADSLILYGRSLGAALWGELKRLGGPYLKNLFAGFSFFHKSRDTARTALDDLLAKETVTGELSKAWLLTLAAFRDSGAASFLDESISRYLLDYRTAADLSTEERFTVINHFLAEMSEAEPLKELEAENLASDLEDKLPGLNPKLTALLEPLSLAKQINGLLAGLLPGEKGETYRFNVESLGMDSQEAVDKLAQGLKEGAASLSGDLAGPLANLPADLLDHEDTKMMLQQILQVAPEATMDFMADLLEDPRIWGFLGAHLESVLKGLEINGVKQKGCLDALQAFFADVELAQALEDALARLLTDTEMNRAVGRLVGDLLTDADLIALLEHVLHQARVISIQWTGRNPEYYIGYDPDDPVTETTPLVFDLEASGFGFGTFEPRGHTWKTWDEYFGLEGDEATDYQVYVWVAPPEGVAPPDIDPHTDDFVPSEDWPGTLKDYFYGYEFDPDNPAANPLYINQYADHPECPAPFDGFITVCEIVLNILPLRIYDYYLQMGFNNGVYFFTETFLEWLDPDLPTPYPAPGKFMEEYLSSFLDEDFTRHYVARPLAKSAVELGEEIVGNEEEITNLFLTNLGLIFTDKNRLHAVVNHLRKDEKPAAILRDGLRALPLNEMQILLRDHPGIKTLLENTFLALPLNLIANLRTSDDFRGIVGDFGVDLNLDPLRPLLRLDDDILEALTQRIASFPVVYLNNFLYEEERAYRMGYTIADMKSRFVGNLLRDPGLILFQADVINEKVAEADYTLAAGIFNTVERITGNAGLIEYSGGKAAELLNKLIATIKDRLGFRGRVSSSAPGEGAGCS